MRSCVLGLVGVCLGCAPVPELDAVQPPQGPVGQEVALTLRGRAFEPGLHAELVGPAFRFALHVDAVTPEQVQARVPADIEAATYDLELRNPDGGEARLAAAYRALEATLSAVVLDVGQGAALLALGSDGSSLLIDGGKEGRATTVLRPAIARLAGGRLDAAVLTHFDEDHLGGLVEWLEGPDGVAGSDDDPELPLGLWDNGRSAACSTDICRRYRAVAAGRNRTLQPGQILALGQATARCVVVDGRIDQGPQLSPDEENAASVGLLLELGGARLLVAGDLPGGGQGAQDLETPLAQALGHVDLWQLNHHGSATSTASSALALHSPRAVLISVGSDNAYCHPAQEVVDRLEAAGVPAYLTGAGMVTTSTACPQRTQLGAHMRVVGEIAVQIDQSGAIAINGDAL